MAALPRFNTPPQVIIGPGASDLVGEEARRLKARRVLLVTEPGIVQMGVADQVLNSLSKAGVAAATYDKVQPDPTDANVAEGLEIFRRDGCNLVVGVGGGTPIDAAKSIAVMSANPGVIADYMGYHKVPNSGAPVIAIPTTAGTGSEVTKVVVIGDTRRGIKMMCLDLHFLAAVALVDYKLTMSMPKGLTANVGLDPLVHAVEAYISRKAHPLTDVLSLSAIRQISGNIRAAWAEPGNETAREAMMLGATMGGMAFSNSSVALVHGMSRPLGALFHLHHGLSNAVLIPAVMAYNAPACGERFADIARAMGLDVAGLGAPEAAQRAVTALVKLNADLQVPRLRDCNIPRDALEKALPKMAADALASGSPANNPRVPTAEEIIELYRQAY